jgi:chemotaxis protein CheX
MSDDETLLGARLSLPQVLDTAAAGQLLNDLIAVRGQPVVIDASAIRRIGGQCLQVLLSARSTWASDNQTLQITDPSQDFLDGLALLGCRDLTDLNPVQD